MEIKAKLNHLRIAPRKVRLVLDLIRGLEVKQAVNQLQFMPKRSSGPILKLLNSAIANAKHNFGVEVNDLFIAKATADKGVTLKRWLPRAFGRASAINKRASHIELVLKTKVGVKAEKGKKNLTAPVKADTKDKAVTVSKEKIEIKSKKPEKDLNRATFKEEGKKASSGPSVVKRVFRRKSI